MKYIFLISSFFFLLSACKTYNEADKSGFDERIEAYVNKHKLALTRSDSGLYYRIDDPGTGEYIKFENVVDFTYKGSLLNGKVFDDRSQEPVSFKVSQLIGAWKEIMLNLKKGGKAYLIAPPQLAYGDRKLDDIPANSILIFELEVTDVR